MGVSTWLFTVHELSSHPVLSDARVLLCSTNGGSVYPMAEDHHPDTPIEATRLRRMMGSALITDSFGESRYSPRRHPIIVLLITNSQLDGRAGQYQVVRALAHLVRPAC